MRDWSGTDFGYNDELTLFGGLIGVLLIEMLENRGKSKVKWKFPWNQRHFNCFARRLSWMEVFGDLRLDFRYLQLEARKRIGIVAKSQVNYAFVSWMVRLCLSGDPVQVRIHQGFRFQLPRINFLTSKLAIEACLQPRSQGISDILTWITPRFSSRCNADLAHKGSLWKRFPHQSAPTMSFNTKQPCFHATLSFPHIEWDELLHN